MRALASHQCVPGSDPGVDAICGLSFSPGTPFFTSPQIKAFPNSNSTRDQVNEEPLCGCAISKSLFIVHLDYIEDWKLTEIYFKCFKSLSFLNHLMAILFLTP